MQCFPDRFVRKEIQALEVKCKGCNWEGLFAEYNTHNKTCQLSREKEPYVDMDGHTDLEAYSSEFEQELSYAQQATDEKSTTERLGELVRKTVTEVEGRFSML